MSNIIQNLVSGWIPTIFNVPTWLSNVIDILAISFAVYKILQWIRDTRAWSLFKGFLIVLVVYIVATLLNLVTLLWVLKMTFNVGLIALVVLFQPELRKALEQIGKGKIFAFLKSDDKTASLLPTASVEEVLKACVSMAEARTGALIVIERNVAMGDLEETGIPIESIISRQLLENIFEDKTPLHDGAVIIRNNRIAAAACILPLTGHEIGKELGTRHRAAVGASEVSDAFVLVVSEETGAISLAQEGKLNRNLTEEQIRAALLERSGKESIVTLPLWRLRRDKKA
ncbi:MAG: diadenylate cyclase CdaA [Clostridiales bacterium]|nr:diadenylate cyclase CdaA [Clostridiales bacterium]MDR2751958.1 diadenylate cyclase CdaA [Clostridiales bacterium]